MCGRLNEWSQFFNAFYVHFHCQVYLGFAIWLAWANCTSVETPCQFQAQVSRSFMGPSYPPVTFSFCWEGLSLMVQGEWETFEAEFPQPSEPDIQPLPDAEISWSPGDAQIHPWKYTLLVTCHWVSVAFFCSLVFLYSYLTKKMRWSDTVCFTWYSRKGTAQLTHRSCLR